MSQRTPAALRNITVASVVPVDAESIGDSLQGLDTNALPHGCLVYSINENTWYRLKKGVTITPPGGQVYLNIVAGLGGGGTWVAVVQRMDSTLVAGTITITTMDLTGTGQFMATAKVAGGTQGDLRVVKTNSTTATVTSSSGSDTSTVSVQYTETDAA